MKKHFVLKVLVLFISFSILSLWFNPTSIFRKKTNTIVLNDRPINISSIEDTSSYVKVDSTDSFNIDKPFDNSFWINNDEIFLSNMFYYKGLNSNIEILNTKTNSSTKIDIKNLSSMILVSPLGNGFLYGSREDYTNKFINGFNPEVYKKMYNNVTKYYYYSLLDNASTPIPEGLIPMNWLPDGSGFIASSNDFSSLVIYDFDSKSTRTFIDSSFDIDVTEISPISISNDGSTYYFSCYDYKLELYSIYKMSKEDMSPKKIPSDMYIRPAIEVINNNLLLLTDQVSGIIFTYDVEKHSRYKITTTSTEFYISNDKSMLVFLERGNFTKLSLVNLNDPNLTATEIFQNKNAISNISWSNHNKLAFQVTDGYNGNNVIYTYSFK